MAIRNNGNYIFDLFNKAVEPYSDELWGSKPISDDRLEEIKVTFLTILQQTRSLGVSGPFTPDSLQLRHITRLKSLNLWCFLICSSIPSHSSCPLNNPLICVQNIASY